VTKELGTDIKYVKNATLPYVFLRIILLLCRLIRGTVMARSYVAWLRIVGLLVTDRPNTAMGNGRDSPIVVLDLSSANIAA